MGKSTLEKVIDAGVRFVTGDPVPEQHREQAARLKLSGTRSQVWTAACDAAKQADEALADFKSKAQVYSKEAEKIKTGQMWANNAEFKAAERALNLARERIQHCQNCKQFVMNVAPDDLLQECKSFNSRIGKLNGQRIQITTELADIERRIAQGIHEKERRDGVVSDFTEPLDPARRDQKIRAEADARIAERLVKIAQSELQCQKDALADVQKELSRLTDRKANVERLIYQLDA